MTDEKEETLQEKSKENQPLISTNRRQKPKKSPFDRHYGINTNISPSFETSKKTDKIEENKSSIKKKTKLEQ